MLLSVSQISVRRSNTSSYPLIRRPVDEKGSPKSYSNYHSLAVDVKGLVRRMAELHADEPDFLVYYALSTNLDFEGEKPLLSSAFTKFRKGLCSSKIAFPPKIRDSRFPELMVYPLWDKWDDEDKTAFKVAVRKQYSWVHLFDKLWIVSVIMARHLQILLEDDRKLPAASKIFHC